MFIVLSVLEGTPRVPPTCILKTSRTFVNTGTGLAQVSRRDRDQIHRQHHKRQQGQAGDHDAHA